MRSQTPEEVLRDTIEALISIVGEQDARRIFGEVKRRMPEVATIGDWMRMIATVASEETPQSAAEWARLQAANPLLRPRVQQ